MYAGYHKAVAPLVQFVSIGQLAAARTKSGALVFNVPVDYMVWTESLAQVAANTDNLAKQLPGLTEKQLWVTGMLSPRARAEMQRMNWKVYEGAEALVVAQDKPYPTYTKENPQTPAATRKAEEPVGRSRRRGELGRRYDRVSRQGVPDHVIRIEPVGPRRVER